MEEKLVNQILIYFIFAILFLIFLTVALYLVLNSSIEGFEQLANDSIAGVSASIGVLSELFAASSLQTDAAIASVLFATSQASVRYSSQVVLAAGNAVLTVGEQSTKLLESALTTTGSVIAAAGSKAVGLLLNIDRGLITMGSNLAKIMMPLFQIVLLTGVVADIYDIVNVTINGAAGQPLCG